MSGLFAVQGTGQLPWFLIVRILSVAFWEWNFPLEIFCTFIDKLSIFWWRKYIFSPVLFVTTWHGGHDAKMLSGRYYFHVKPLFYIWRGFRSFYISSATVCEKGVFCLCLLVGILWPSQKDLSLVQCKQLIIRHVLLPFVAFSWVDTTFYFIISASSLCWKRSGFIYITVFCAV